MEIVKDGFWDYAQRWHDIFTGDRKLRWEKFWLENEFCADCRFCCGPQDSDTPFPMPLLPRQSGLDAEKRFHLLDFETAYLAKAGCKSDSPHGCKLKLEEKPLACGFFPIVFANGGLHLYQNCPAVIFTPLWRFMEFAKKVADILMELPEKDLLHLSICLPAPTLGRCYIDLHVTLLHDGRKELVFG